MKVLLICSLLTIGCQSKELNTTTIIPPSLPITEFESLKLVNGSNTVNETTLTTTEKSETSQNETAGISFVLKKKPNNKAHKLKKVPMTTRIDNDYRVKEENVDLNSQESRFIGNTPNLTKSTKIHETHNFFSPQEKLSIKYKLTNEIEKGEGRAGNNFVRPSKYYSFGERKKPQYTRTPSRNRSQEIRNSEESRKNENYLKFSYKFEPITQETRSSQSRNVPKISERPTLPEIQNVIHTLDSEEDEPSYTSPKQNHIVEVTEVPLVFEHHYQGDYKRPQSNFIAHQYSYSPPADPTDEAYRLGKLLSQNVVQKLESSEEPLREYVHDQHEVILAGFTHGAPTYSFLNFNLNPADENNQNTRNLNPLVKYLAPEITQQSFNREIQHLRTAQLNPYEVARPHTQMQPIVVEDEDPRSEYGTTFLHALGRPHQQNQNPQTESHEEVYHAIRRPHQNQNQQTETQEEVYHALERPQQNLKQQVGSHEEVYHAIGSPQNQNQQTETQEGVYHTIGRPQQNLKQQVGSHEEVYRQNLKEQHQIHENSGPSSPYSVNVQQQFVSVPKYTMNSYKRNRKPQAIHEVEPPNLSGLANSYKPNSIRYHIPPESQSQFTVLPNNPSYTDADEHNNQQVTKFESLIPTTKLIHYIYPQTSQNTLETRPQLQTLLSPFWRKPQVMKLVRVPERTNKHQQETQSYQTHYQSFRPEDFETDTRTRNQQLYQSLAEHYSTPVRMNQVLKNKNPQEYSNNIIRLVPQQITQQNNFGQFGSKPIVVADVYQNQDGQEETRESYYPSESYVDQIDDGQTVKYENLIGGHSPKERPSTEQNQNQGNVEIVKSISKYYPQIDHSTNVQATYGKAILQEDSQVGSDLPKGYLAAQHQKNYSREPSTRHIMPLVRFRNRDNYDSTTRIMNPRIRRLVSDILKDNSRRKNVYIVMTEEE